MTENLLLIKCKEYLKTLCINISERPVGSNGNRQATCFFERELSLSGWETEMVEFEAIDWEDNGAFLKSDEENFNVLVSPYSLGFRGEAELISASTIEELSKINAKNKIIFLSGEIAREQLMPKNFVFYNPEEHRNIISLLENSGAKAIISATGRNAALAGGVYPFPLIEDGDFDIPSVYMTEKEGLKLRPRIGKIVFLESKSERIPGKGFNVIGKKGISNSQKIVVTAHIDAKKGTPGAIDNATGVIVLLLLSDLLKDYNGNKLIEIVAFNGEDYYAVPGQMNYISANKNNFNRILLNINIDGAGYEKGLSAFSLFNLPDEIIQSANKVINQYSGITEGVQWPQGDHSIFLQFGVPAIAVSSKWFIDNIGDQDITHTPKDNIGIVDCNKIVEISLALNSLIRCL
ncbi:MAG TPA: M28 family peptidase [Bacteroidales bacterium]|jgi:aminopeptidase YwaD|nr:M28 family peptidase [Bacteroidales bacterium]HOX74707.1 M28 family peptidase [Bacteroidales bacterium]HPM87297.1 M28 family peptidase [Bacteroidales bacterium]HQM69495.1 M28 family peptidase [Bacteroidales bacterium]